MAAQNFVAQNDGFLGYDGMNNFYFYRLEDTTRHVFIAWDEDNAFLSADFPLTTRHEENVLMRKMMEAGAWRAQYLQRAPGGRRLGGAGRRTGRAEGWLLAEMRRQLDLIGDAMREDPSKPYYQRRARRGQGRAARASRTARIAYVRCESARATGAALPAGCS